MGQKATSNLQAQPIDVNGRAAILPMTERSTKNQGGRAQTKDGVRLRWLIPESILRLPVDTGRLTAERARLLASKRPQLKAVSRHKKKSYCNRTTGAQQPDHQV
jgi:hypothetical protein